MKFIKGVDLSTLYELENCHAVYYDHGVPRDVLDILKEREFDTVRIRIWNDPYSEAGESYGAGENSVQNSLYIAKKVTDAGFKVLLDFHYSDFWTDPGKQFKPKAWRNYSVEELQQAVEAFTYETVRQYLAEGVAVTMVQIGNEISNGMLWPQGQIADREALSSYENVTRFVDAGLRGLKRADEEKNRALKDNEGKTMEHILSMIHLDQGGDNHLYRNWFDYYMALSTESFDLIGLSYYPFWHGDLRSLEENMADIATRYHKDLIVAEVSMGFSMEDYRSREGLAKEEAKGYATRQELVEQIEYPMTPEGQRDFVKDFLERITRIPENRGKGFFWWEPAWIPVKGSGWATPASLEYLEDPGPVGNEWANQALFDYDGNPLPAMEYIREFKR